MNQKVLERKRSTPKTCRVSGCENLKIAHGLCHGHYKRLRRWGSESTLKSGKCPDGLGAWTRRKETGERVVQEPPKEIPTSSHRQVLAEPLFK